MPIPPFVAVPALCAVAFLAIGIAEAGFFVALYRIRSARFGVGTKLTALVACGLLTLGTIAVVIVSAYRHVAPLMPAL